LLTGHSNLSAYMRRLGIRENVRDECVIGDRESEGGIASEWGSWVCILERREGIYQEKGL